MKGCMSEVFRSFFSYQVAVGSTMSGVQTGGAHAEVERDQQVQLAFGPCVMPFDFLGLGIVGTQVLALHAVGGTSRCLRKYSWPLPDEPRMLDRHTNMLRGQFRDYPDLHMTASRLPSFSAATV